MLDQFTKQMIILHDEIIELKKENVAQNEAIMKMLDIMQEQTLLSKVLAKKIQVIESVQSM